MIDRSSISRPTSFYDLFLYAPVCDQRNGMQLTVISALARMNKDPWEEAARMTAMPKAAAEKELVSILRRASDITWMQPEAEAIAVRLTQLLPRDGGNGRAAPTDAVRVVRVYVRRSLLWLVWLGFAMPVSLMPPRDRSKVADPSVAAPSSSVISASESHISNKN